MLRISLITLAVVSTISLSSRAETLSGEVDFTGKAPTPNKLHREADPACSQKEAFDESISVNNGKLANVWVHVVAGAPDSKAAADAAPVVVDQLECMYRPRVQAALVGQKIVAKNDDQTLHNVHAYLGSKQLFNKGMPNSKSKPVEQVVDADGLVKLKCDVHSWMRGYIGVNKNPFQAVTGDAGTFKIDLPPGDYTVEAWQEKLGVKSATIKVEAGKPARLVFKYDGTEKGS
jgi:plastocyanin